MKIKLLKDESGFALITALLMSVIIMLMAAVVLYVISQSTTMSGAGKRYATASEAADGSIEVLKDAINVIQHGDTLAALFPTGNCITTAIQNQGPQGACNTTTITLPGTIGSYTATVAVTNLYTLSLPGGRLEFARSAGGPPSTAIFYRISTKVVGPNNEVAENAALYRFAQ